jgi:hypothetical protein
VSDLFFPNLLDSVTCVLFAWSEGEREAREID